MDPALEFLPRILGGEATRDQDGIEVSLRVLRRAGQPFLLLPANRREAVATLNLYAPQIARARAARGLLRWCLVLAAPWPGQRFRLNVQPDAPFWRFLTSLPSAAPSPRFGILAGNPASPGQRFLLLCFDAEHRPCAVVKAGLTPRAHELIQCEETILASVAGKFKGIPALLATFRSGQVRAIATPFAPGRSPRQSDESVLPALLNAWVDTERTIPLSEAPAWRTLEEACAADRQFQAIASKLRFQQVHPCLQHGDFVPWNIKVSPDGGWTVLDWERGQLTGIPGWDWFHYILQTGILVKRLPTRALVRQAEQLLASDSFQDYALRTGISGIERQLLLSYLFHLVEVIQPSEGRVEARNLLTTLAEAWRPVTGGE
jgi:hypothetical protein